MRGSIRAFIAVLLLALFPFFVVALGVGGVLIGLKLGHRQGVYIAVIGVSMMVALGFGLVQALRTRLTPSDGPRLSRHEQPGLWRLVDELAAIARTRPPDEITLVPEINAAVCEDAKSFGLRPGKRYMMIGLPLLAGLNVAELRSVLAHELGHYGGGHTRLLAISYRGAETLRRTVSRLDSGIARWILQGYARLYLLLSRSANRTQELQADAYSVAAAGRVVAAGALRRVAVLDQMWEMFVGRMVRLAGLAERTPDILLGFRAFCGHPEQRRIIDELQAHVLDSESSSLFDSHPTLRQRIVAMRAMPEGPPRVDERPAWSVLTNPAQVIPAAEAALYLAKDLGPRAGWEEIAQRAGAADAARGAELLARAAYESGAAPSSALGDILYAIQRGEAERLVRPLLRGDESLEQVQRAACEGLTELLSDIVVCALLNRAQVRHELDWASRWRVVGGAGELRVTDLVAPAVRDPALVPQLARRLTALGVPLQFVRWPSEPRTQQPQEDGKPRLLAVAPAIWAFRTTWDVLMYDTGILLVPLGASKVAGQNLAGVAGQANQVQRDRINKLLQQGDNVFAHPGACWLSAAALHEAERKKFAVSRGGKVLLRLPDGKTTSLRTESDDVYQILTEYFDTVVRRAHASLQPV